MENSLTHHGIKNQRWGFRRFQNPDGTLTEAGKRRYYGSGANYDRVMYRFSRKATYRKDENKNPIDRSNFDININSDKVEEIFGGRSEYNKVYAKMRKDARAGKLDLSAITEGMFLNHEEAKRARERGEEMINELKNYSDTAKDIGRIASEAGRTLGRGIDDRKDRERILKADKEARQLSIEELKERAARLAAEESYISARTKELKRGEQTTEDILSNVGSYIGLATSGIVAYSNYKNRYGNRDD